MTVLPVHNCFLVSHFAEQETKRPIATYFSQIYSMFSCLTVRAYHVVSEKKRNQQRPF